MQYNHTLYQQMVRKLSRQEDLFFVQNRKKFSTFLHAAPIFHNVFPYELSIVSYDNPLIAENVIYLGKGFATDVMQIAKGLRYQYVPNVSNMNQIRRTIHHITKGALL